jgi:hypothetical protein
MERFQEDTSRLNFKRGGGIKKTRKGEGGREWIRQWISMKRRSTCRGLFSSLRGVHLPMYCYLCKENIKSCQGRDQGASVFLLFL